MRKAVVLLALMLGLFVSCTKDDCTEEAQIEYLDTKTPDEESLIVSEDMCIEGDLTLDFLTINGDYNLYVDGDGEGERLFVHSDSAMAMAMAMAAALIL